MAVIKVTSENFEKEVIDSNVPVLADFNAEWCGPCRMLAPIIEEISEEYSDIKVVSINIDNEDELADNYEISSIPCVILFKNGKETDRSIGLKPKNAILEFMGK